MSEKIVQPSRILHGLRHSLRQQRECAYQPKQRSEKAKPNDTHHGEQPYPIVRYCLFLGVL